MMEKAEKQPETEPAEAESRKEKTPVDEKMLEKVSGGLQPGGGECYTDLLGGLVHIGLDRN